ncbi:heme lyase, partial [Vibrio parahaemolyticus V-223/04]
APCCFGS